jgi:hypothetical protein
MNNYLLFIVILLSFLSIIFCLAACETVDVYKVGKDEIIISL